MYIINAMFVYRRYDQKHYQYTNVSLHCVIYGNCELYLIYFSIFQVPENTSLNSILYTFVASDSDTSLHGPITYFINDSAILPVFHIASQNATLILTSPLDFETVNKSYEFYVYAIDNGNRTGRALVTVQVTDVNDNAPVFTGEFIC